MDVAVITIIVAITCCSALIFDTSIVEGVIGASAGIATIAKGISCSELCPKAFLSCLAAVSVIRCVRQLTSFPGVDYVIATNRTWLVLAHIVAISSVGSELIAFRLCCAAAVIILAIIIFELAVLIAEVLKVVEAKGCA